MELNPLRISARAATIMATDLAAQPTAGIPVQAAGDSHLMNFGAFVTPENNILFDVNDFDETLPGVDFTVDLKRLAAERSRRGARCGTPEKSRREVWRQQPSEPIGCISLHSPNCRRWRSGTAGSTSNRRSAGSAPAVCGGSWLPWSPGRAVRASPGTTIFRILSAATIRRSSTSRRASSISIRRPTRNTGSGSNACSPRTERASIRIGSGCSTASR